MAKRTVVGFTEKVVIQGKKGKKQLVARIDTGALKSSVDTRIAGEVGLGPIIKSRIVRSANGRSLRPVVRGKVSIAGRELRAEFTVVDRRHMKYSALIGQDVLKQGFLIDPSKGK
jgi:hypothetical protein